MPDPHRRYPPTGNKLPASASSHPAGGYLTPADLWYPVPPKPHRRLWPLVLAFGILFLIAIAVGAALGLVLWLNSDLIMPGVHVAGADLGRLSTYDAAATMQSRWQQPIIAVEGGGETRMTSPEALGFSLDTEATLAEAQRVGRSWTTFEAWLANSGRADLAPLWTFDQAVTQTHLQTLAWQISMAPVDAGVTIVDGSATMSPAKPGRILDVPATLAQLAHNPDRVLDERRLELVISPVQPAVVDSSELVAEANRLLTMQITVEVYDPVAGEGQQIMISPDAWRPWLALELGPADEFHWVIDQSRLRTFLTEQSTKYSHYRYLDIATAVNAMVEAIESGQTAISLRLYYNDRQHLVQAGETLASIGRQYGLPYPWIQQANPGLGDGLYAGQTLTIPSPDLLLPMPVIADKRILVNISEQRVRVFEGGALKWDWPASTGIDTSPTSPGVFQVQSHQPNAYASNWDLWMPHFMGVYRPVPNSDFMNGFHGFPTRSGHNLLWTGDLGRKVTYGCILLSSENAEALYNWAEDGVVVQIVP